MQSQTTQIRVTLPIQLQGFLQAKASKYGLSLSAYIRNLVIDDVQDVAYPFFEMSDQSLNELKAAKEAGRTGKLVKTNTIDQLFNEL